MDPMKIVTHFTSGVSGLLERLQDKAIKTRNDIRHGSESLKGLRLKDKHCIGSHASQSQGPTKDSSINATLINYGSSSASPDESLRAYNPGDGSSRRSMELTEESSRDATDGLDFVDREQYLRQQAYIGFEEEAQEDYTEGRARFVDASDGVKECAALLMTMELSKKVQEAVEQQRVFVREEADAIQKDFALLNLESEVEAEISGHELRIEKLSSEAIDENDMSKLRTQLANLQSMLQNVKDRQQALEEQRRFQAQTLMRYQSHVMETLGEAFSVAGLITPQIEQLGAEAELMDFQEEYKAFMRQQQEAKDYLEKGSVGDLERFAEESFKAEPQQISPKEQAELDIKHTFFGALGRLQAAEDQFDHRDEARKEDRLISVEPDEVFDLRWIQQYREFTQELIESERLFVEARKTMWEAGIITVQDDQTSMFADADDDGYHISHEADCLASVPEEKIARWLGSLPKDASVEGLESDNFADVDQWLGEDVDTSDSLSVMAHGRRRRKIDGWNRCNDRDR